MLVQACEVITLITPSGTTKSDTRCREDERSPKLTTVRARGGQVELPAICRCHAQARSFECESCMYSMSKYMNLYV